MLTGADPAACRGIPVTPNTQIRRWKTNGIPEKEKHEDLRRIVVEK